MGLAHPVALLLLPLLLLVPLLHRHRRMLPRVLLHAPFLLPPAARLERGGARGWRDRLHLLLRLLIAALLVLGLAGPWRRGAGPERMVAVVERGLGAALPLADGRSRYAAALEDAARAFEEAAPARALVLLAGAEPEAASGWLAPKAAIAAAARIDPGLGSSNLAPALAEARRLAGPEGAVVLARAPAEAVPGNRSLVALTFRAHRGEPNRGVLGVRLRTQGLEEGSVLLRLETGSGLLSEVRVEVPSTGETTAAIAYRGPGGCPLRAVLVNRDPFRADDEAWIKLPPLGPRRVALVTPGNEELVRALRSIPRLELALFPPGSRPGAEEADLVIAEAEDAGGWADGPGPPVVLVAPAGPLLQPPVPVDDPDPAARVTVEAEARPGLQSLAGLAPRPVRALPAAPSGARVLARLGAAPVLWTGESGSRLRAALAFDPGAAGLGGSALHAAFWDDLLDELLVPPDGGCRPAKVGERIGGGLLERPGVYELPGGCVVASLPFPESPEDIGSDDRDYEAIMEANAEAEAGQATKAAAAAAPGSRAAAAPRAAVIPASRAPLAPWLALLLLGLCAVERALSLASHRPPRSAAGASR